MAITEPEKGPDSPKKTINKTSPPPKCAAAARALIGDSKRRRLNKFYQKQSNLVENFVQDSRQIQNAQQKRMIHSQNSIRSAAESDQQQQLGKEESQLDMQLLDESLPLGQRDFELLEEADCETRLLGPPKTTSISVKNLVSPSGESHSQVRAISSISPRHSLPSTVIGGAHKSPLARSARRLAFLTLLVNLALTIAKLFASYLSGSLAIISSLVDSLVDITSGLVIWLTGRAIRKHDPYLYPVGRTRLEPVALVIVSVIMAVASVQMIVQSLESIFQKRIHPVVDWPIIAIMVATVIVKLGLFFLCSRLRNDPSTRVLAQDHRNDCLSNSIALLCAFGAQKFWLYLDPIGAIVVALYIAITWFRTGREHLIMLSGRSAEPEFINRIIKVCIDHDSRIQYIDTVYVYHFGTRFLVEVHIVLDQNMLLKEAHDIAESLQNSIEALPDVERAFLHVDYEFEHKPQDEHKIP